MLVKSVSRLSIVVACLGLWCCGASVRAEDPPSAVGPLMKLFQSGRLPEERQGAVVEMICNRGNEHDLRVVFDKAMAADGLPAPLRSKTLDWLTEAVHTRKVKPTGDLSALVKLAESNDPRIQRQAIHLASACQVDAISPALQNLALNPKTPPALQQTAIEGLVTLGGEANKSALLKLARSGTTLAVRFQAIAGLVGLDLTAAAKLAALALHDATPQDDPAAMMDAFLTRKEGSDHLAQALQGQQIAVDVAKRALRYMYSVGRSDAALSNILSELAGVATDPAPPSQEEVAKLVQEVTAKGDPARGELIFRRTDISCMRCHSVSRAGGQVGPELSAVGGSSPLDYIVNSVLNPNLAVKEQFVTRVFALADGQVLSGVLIDRDETRVRIRDAQGKTLTIPTSDIDEEVEGQSMMPTGLTKFLTHQELLDLIRFVSELGKPGAYAVQSVPTIQRWQLLKNPPPELTDDVPHLENLRQYVLGSPPENWASVYGKVAGVLPLSELRKDGAPTVAILRGEIQVNEAGPVDVQVTTTEKAQVWIDAQAFESQPEFQLPLEAGRHQIIVRVEISDRPQPELKIQLTRPEGAATQFEVIGGP